MCIFFNIVMVPMYFLFAIAFAQGGKIDLFALTAFTAVAFAFSLYFLLKKETALFFSPPEKRGTKRPVIRHAILSEGAPFTEDSAVESGE